MSDANTFQPPVQPPATPNPALRTLDRLVGTWALSDPTGNDGINGQVRFEWMDGDFFLLQHVEIEQGGRTETGIEYIGFDEASQKLRSHYFDSKGMILEYVYELDGDDLTIWAGDVGSPAAFRGKFDGDDLNTGAWVWPGGGYSSKMTRVKSA